MAHPPPFLRNLNYLQYGILLCVELPDGMHWALEDFCLHRLFTARGRWNILCWSARCLTLALLTCRLPAELGDEKEKHHVWHVRLLLYYSLSLFTLLVALSGRCIFIIFDPLMRLTTTSHNIAFVTSMTLEQLT